MAITIDPSNKLLILDSASTTAQAIYSAWADWMLLSDNLKYLPAFSSVGGDDLGGGLFVPPYFFLMNGWRVRPMESNHMLVLGGNLFVDGGGQPVVQTVGSYNVSVQYTVPVQAQAFSTAGSTGPTPNEIALAVKNMLMNAPILPVDVQQINSTEITGTGIVSDKWRPA
jgi:hypothetical protein